MSQQMTPLTKVITQRFKYLAYYDSYLKTKSSKELDFRYPVELEITALKGKEKLHLKFSMISDTIEKVKRLPDEKLWEGIAVCEILCDVDGYYFDGIKRMKLSGICKIEPQRQISLIGHSSLKVDFLLPPEGVGISMNLDSHFFKKKIFISIRLALSPKIKFNFSRVDSSKIHKNKI